MALTGGHVAGSGDHTGDHNLIDAALAAKAGLPANAVAKTAAYTAVAGDFVLADTTTAPFTVTLPAAPVVGAVVSVKKTDVSVNVLTIAPSGTGNIDGDPTATTTTRWAGAVLEHVGADAWRVVAVMTSGQGPTGPVGPAGPTGATGAAGAPGTAGATGPAGTNGAISTIQDEGVALTVRPTLNFIGAAVTAADDAVNLRTNITVTAATGATGAGAFYGDGSDGTVTFDGTAAVAGTTRAGTVYTLVRNVYYAAATVNATVSIDCAGFVFHVSGTLTNAGIVQRDGNTTTTNGGAAAQSGQVLAAGAGGGNGAAPGGAGTASSSGVTTIYTASAGNGGNSGTGTAGGAGASTGTSGSNFDTSRTQLSATTSFLFGGSFGRWTAGAGGGGGGNDAVNPAGGGGGGGGVVIVNAKTVVNNGGIRSRGGNGADASLTGNSAGGGGGTGGVVIVNTTAYSGTGTVDANGGAAGASRGTATAATAGGAGVARINVWS